MNKFSVAPSIISKILLYCFFSYHPRISANWYPSDIFGITAVDRRGEAWHSPEHRVSAVKIDRRKSSFGRSDRLDLVRHAEGKTRVHVSDRWDDNKFTKRNQRLRNLTSVDYGRLASDTTLLRSSATRNRLTGILRVRSRLRMGRRWCTLGHSWMWWLGRL